MSVFKHYLASIGASDIQKSTYFPVVIIEIIISYLVYIVVEKPTMGISSRIKYRR